MCGIDKRPRLIRPAARRPGVRGVGPRSIARRSRVELDDNDLLRSDTTNEPWTRAALRIDDVVDEESQAAPPGVRGQAAGTVHASDAETSDLVDVLALVIEE